MSDVQKLIEELRRHNFVGQYCPNECLRCRTRSIIQAQQAEIEELKRYQDEDQQEAHDLSRENKKLRAERDAYRQVAINWKNALDPISLISNDNVDAEAKRIMEEKKRAV